MKNELRKRSHTIQAINAWEKPYITTVKKTGIPPYEWGEFIVLYRANGALHTRKAKDRKHAYELAKTLYNIHYKDKENKTC